MKDRDLSAILDLAKLKNHDQEEYGKILSSIKEVVKDIVRLETEIFEEVEAENKEKKRKAVEELDAKIADKMKRDKPRTWKK